jgi:hypothetical protein
VVKERVTIYIFGMDLRQVDFIKQGAEHVKNFATADNENRTLTHCYRQVIRKKQGGLAVRHPQQIRGAISHSSRDNDVDAVGEDFADRLMGLSPHDDHVIRGDFLEAPKVGLKSPWQTVLATDYVVRDAARDDVSD